MWVLLSFLTDRWGSKLYQILDLVRQMASLYYHVGLPQSRETPLMKRENSTNVSPVLSKQDQNLGPFRKKRKKKLTIF